MAVKGKGNRGNGKPTAKKESAKRVGSPGKKSAPEVAPAKSRSAPLVSGLPDEEPAADSGPFNLNSFNTLLTELVDTKWGLAANKRKALTERLVAIGLDEEASSGTVINAYNSLLEGAKLDAQSRLTVLKIVADGYAASVSETSVKEVPALSQEEVKAAVNALMEPSREEAIPTPARRGVKLAAPVQEDDEYERVG